MTTFTTEDRVKAEKTEPVPFAGNMDINDDAQTEFDFEQDEIVHELEKRLED